MPLLLNYTHLKKLSATGKQTLFSAERAIGLSIEAGHKFAQQHGLGNLTPGSLQCLKVSGGLQIWDGIQWKASRTCSLKLKEQDAQLACLLVQKQRAFISDMQANIWSLDLFVPKLQASLDMVLDFSTTNSYDIKGRVFSELKFFTTTRWSRKVAAAQDSVQKHFVELRNTGFSTEGALLLCCTAEQLAGGVWHNPSIIAKLYTQHGGWVDVSPTSKKRSSNLTLASVWKKMSWWDAQEGGPKRGVLDDFLAAAGKPTGNGGKNAKKFNKLLVADGCKGKLTRVKLRHRSGSRPWSGPKSVFRAIYKRL